MMHSPGQELAVRLDRHILVVTGDSTIVANYIDALTNQAVDWTGTRTPLQPDMLSILTSALENKTAVGEYVQMSTDALRSLQAQGILPARDGVFRSLFRAHDVALGRTAWVPVQITMEHAIHLQTMGTLLALMAAVRDVRDAVRAVEDKVDDVLALYRAQHVGDVLGRYRFLREALDTATRAEGVSSATWAAVAPVGADVTVTVERLRSYLLTSVRALPANARIDDRTERLRRLVSEGRFTETLALLVVAQHTLYMWHQLRLMHVRRTEPRHLVELNDEARSVLSANEAADTDLITGMYDALTVYGAVKVREIHRLASKRRLHQDVLALREAFEMFAAARDSKVHAWPELPDPLRDALEAIESGARAAKSRARVLSAKGMSASSARLGHWAERLQAQTSNHSIDALTIASQEPAGPSMPDPESSSSSPMGPLSSLSAEHTAREPWP